MWVYLHFYGSNHQYRFYFYMYILHSVISMTIDRIWILHIQSHAYTSRHFILKFEFSPSTLSSPMCKTRTWLSMSFLVTHHYLVELQHTIITSELYLLLDMKWKLLKLPQIRTLYNSIMTQTARRAVWVIIIIKTFSFCCTDRHLQKTWYLARSK